MVKRVLVILRTLEQEPQECTKEAITLLPLSIPLPPFSKPFLKVPKTFREWKIITQTEWRGPFFEDEFFKRLVMVFALSNPPFERQG